MPRGSRWCDVKIYVEFHVSNQCTGTDQRYLVPFTSVIKSITVRVDFQGTDTFILPELQRLVDNLRLCPTESGKNDNTVLWCLTLVSTELAKGCPGWRIMIV